MFEFEPFEKIPRLSRNMVISEKLDGTNASVWVIPAGKVYLPNPAFMSTVVSMVPTGGSDDEVFYIKAGSRKRFVMPGKGTDNYGFAGWVADNASELVKLGEGVHYGEWWGQSIQRRYGLDHKRFSLFNSGRWADNHEPIFAEETREVAPQCCHVVPVLYQGPFNTDVVDGVMDDLKENGSFAAPGYMKPEGVIVYLSAARSLFKKTFEHDDTGKEQAA